MERELPAEGRKSQTVNMVDCDVCGQAHDAAASHIYDYVGQVEEDLNCQICLQPFVLPVDLPCGHTLCKKCLLDYYVVQQVCPSDSLPFTLESCRSPSLIVKKWMIPSFAWHLAGTLSSVS